MDSNPYATQIPMPSQNDETGKPRFLASVAGFLFGAMCGAMAGFASGALTGFTYRLFNDLFVGIVFFGLEFTCRSPLDFAAFHGALALVPCAIWGAIVGVAQGYSLCQNQRGIRGFAIFCFGVMLVSCLNGVIATMRLEEIIPHFWEGPFAGAVFGIVAGIGAWLIFLNRLRSIVLQPKVRQLTFILWKLLSILLCCSLLFGSLWQGQLGDYAFRVKMQFATIIALTAVFANLFMLWKCCDKKVP